MKKDTLLAFAVDTPYMGCRNQILGALDAINKNSKTALPAEKCLLLPSGAETVDDMRESLCYAHFGSYRSFQNEIFALLDARLPQLPAVPRVFITAYNLTESGAADKNADMLCRAVKEYYRRHNLGKIFTVVLISRLHNYKYVDLVNVPKHLLTFYSRIRLLQNKKLRQKTLITVGTVHKFNAARTGIETTNYQTQKLHPQKQKSRHLPRRTCRRQRNRFQCQLRQKPVREMRRPSAPRLRRGYRQRSPHAERRYRLFVRSGTVSA